MIWGFLVWLWLLVGDWLNIVLVDGVFLFVNLWSFVHLFGGFLLVVVVSVFWCKRLRGWGDLFWWLACFVLPFFLAWEFFEFFVWGVIGSGLFRPEILLDVFWDVVFGGVGFVVGFLLLRGLRR